MKKSIAILSIFLVSIFCTSPDKKGASTETQMEVRSVSSPFQNHLLSLSAGFSSSEDENDPDPPRQDPWQWRNALEKLMELLKYLSSNK